ncbi:MAG: ComF family protein [Epulopiscium sp.]|nr:ComF family protein [Candidatus Epulonipiscium sp.]
MRYLDIILDIIYPPRCIFCKDIIPIQKEKGICEECKKNLSFVEGKTCQRCGKPIEKKRDTCLDCIKYPPEYEKGWAVFVYEGLIRDMMYRFKYGGYKEYARYLGHLMADKIRNEAPNEKFDLIIPIPIHPNRKKSRGYNQGEELAKTISKELNSPMDTSILIRTKETRPQSGLTIIERKNNIKNAFKIKINMDLKQMKILLVDDIYTTGATINSCAKLLKNKNAGKIYFVSLSIGHS